MPGPSATRRSMSPRRVGSARAPKTLSRSCGAPAHTSSGGSSAVANRRSRRSRRHCQAPMAAAAAARSSAPASCARRAGGAVARSPPGERHRRAATTPIVTMLARSGPSSLGHQRSTSRRSGSNASTTAWRTAALVVDETAPPPGRERSSIRPRPVAAIRVAINSPGSSATRSSDRHTSGAARGSTSRVATAARSTRGAACMVQLYGCACTTATVGSCATNQLHSSAEAIVSVLVPTVVESTARGERLTDLFSRLLGARIVFLGNRHRRHLGQPRRGPAAPPRRRPPEPGHQPVHQLPGRRHDRACSPSTTPCARSCPDVATTCVGQAARRRRCCWRPARRASASCCPTPGC